MLYAIASQVQQIDEIEKKFNNSLTLLLCSQSSKYDMYEMLSIQGDADIF